VLLFEICYCTLIVGVAASKYQSSEIPGFVGIFSFLSMLRKPHVSKMAIYNALNFNMYFLPACNERDFSETLF